MPLVLILALFVAAYLVAPIDPVTLRATRFAGGAATAAIRSGRPGSTRSTPPRSAGPRTKPARSKSPRSGPIDPRPDRHRSRIATAIRGGIAAVDQAEARRGDLRNAAREWWSRIQQRRSARRIDRAWATAEDENDRRDRADRLARIRGGVKQIAEQIDPAPEPAPPAEQPAGIDPPNGDPVPTKTDLVHIGTTEMNTLYQLGAESFDAFKLAEQLHQGVSELNGWLTNLPERASSGDYLYTTAQTQSAIALLKEQQLTGLQQELRSVMGRLDTLMKAVEIARNGVKESDALSGRVESARAE